MRRDEMRDAFYDVYGASAASTTILSIYLIAIYTRDIVFSPSIYGRYAEAKIQGTAAKNDVHFVGDVFFALKSAQRPLVNTSVYETPPIFAHRERGLLRPSCRLHGFLLEDVTKRQCRRFLFQGFRLLPPFPPAILSAEAPK